MANGKLDPEASPLVFTRGRADVSRLHEVMATKGETIWTDEVTDVLTLYGAMPLGVRTEDTIAAPRVDPYSFIVPRWECIDIHSV